MCFAIFSLISSLEVTFPLVNIRGMLKKVSSESVAFVTVFRRPLTAEGCCAV